MLNVLVILFKMGVRSFTRWVGAVVLVTCIGLRLAASVTKHFGFSRPMSVDGLPAMGQQLLDPAIELCRQPRENVFQVGEGVVPIELGRLQQAHHMAVNAGADLRLDLHWPMAHTCAGPETNLNWFFFCSPKGILTGNCCIQAT